MTYKKSYQICDRCGKKKRVHNLIKFKGEHLCKHCLPSVATIIPFGRKTIKTLKQIEKLEKEKVINFKRLNKIKMEGDYSGI